MIKNKSAYETEKLRPLLDLAFREARRESRSSLRAVSIALNRTRSRTYCCSFASGAAVLSLTSDPGRCRYFPVRFSYLKCADLNEVVVAASAWLFARSTGCNWALSISVSATALTAYRKTAEEVKAKIEAVKSAEEKALDEFAETVFEEMERSTLDFKLSKIDRLEKVWRRKFKLAETKLQTLKRRRSALIAADNRKRKATCVSQESLPSAS